MGKQVTVSTFVPVPGLPVSSLYKVGATVVLSDAQYAALPSGFAAAALTNISTVSDPVPPAPARDSDVSDAEGFATAAIATQHAADNASYAAILNRTAIKTANYTAVASDLIPVDTTSGSVTVTLPNAPLDCSRVVVKHVIQGGTNTVSFACAGSDVFNKVGGGTTLTLTLVNQALQVQYDATTHIWTVVADDLPLSVLDARFLSPSVAAAAYETITTYDLRTYGFHTATTDAGRTTAFAAACADACAAKLATGVRAEVYVPAGSWTLSLSSGAWVLLTTGIRIRGHGRGYTTLKLTAASGNFVALIVGVNAATTDLSDLEVCNLKFDYNGNIAPDQTALDAGSRNVVKVGKGDRVAVRHCRFINVDGYQALVLSGGGGLSHITVADNVFEVSASSAFWHDHSTIYTYTANNGSGTTIVNNVFIGNGSLGARTAMETHGSAQQVHGNRVKGYAVGGNLTGVADPASESIIWANNIFRAVGVGILLWSDTYQTSATPGLTNVSVHDNSITLDINTWVANLVAVGTGIQLSGSSTSFGTRNVSIHDNNIRLLPFSSSLTSSNSHSAGVSWRRTIAGDDYNLRIYNNVIDGAIACGVELAIGGALIGGKCSDNTILNSGQGVTTGGFSTTFTSGILCTSTPQHFRIENNQIRDDQGTHTMSFPIHLASIGASSTGVRVAGNRASYADGTSAAVVKSSVTSGIAVYAEYETSAYVAPSGNFEVGSRILDRTTGIERKQTTAPNGNSWLRSKSADTAPTVAPGASIGTSPTGPTITGNDRSGFVQWTAGTGPATGAQAVITFANAYSVAPVVLLTAGTTSATGRQICAISVTTTGFSISFSSAATAGSGYTVNYLVTTGA